MGVLVPEDFPLDGLANEGERRVVEALRDGLTDGWLVFPDVAIRSHRDFQLDVVLVHRTYGVLDIEVKSHRVEVRNGRWYARGAEMAPQPLDQARNNAYALRDLLRARVAGLERLEVEYGVALPNTVSYDGRLPPGAQPVQVLTEAHLQDVAEAVELLAVARHTTGLLTDEQVAEIVALLRPDVHFRWDPAARLRASRTRLDELATQQTQILERLDANRRVVALGAAGTGKTRLVVGWARRAYLRDERVLVTCYNEPLADQITDQLPEDPDLRVGAFLRVALGLDGMPPLPVPDDADHAWWTVTAVGYLVAHWAAVTERFDTIVVDEAQDFSPAWLALLEALLDPAGPRRMLVVADPLQELYVRGFTVPSTDDGWVHCELVNNCRNARGIASLLRRRLHGAPAPALGPEAVDLRFVSVDGTGPGSTDPQAPGAGDDGPGDRLTRIVGAELERLVAVEERQPDQVLVLTFATRVRDRLAASLGLQRWEDRSKGIVCENAHRLKGIESDTVVLVADTEDVADELLYVGISRAVSELVVVGPPGLAGRLGL